MSKSDKEKTTRECVRDLRKRAAGLGLCDDEIKALFKLDPTNNTYKTFTRDLKTKLLARKHPTLSTPYFSWKYSIRKEIYLPVFLAIAGYFLLPFWGDDFGSFLEDSLKERCILDLPVYMVEVARPQVPCGMCKDLKQFPVVHNISREEFTNWYAYTGVPVLIKGAMTDWGALQTFNYQYFKSVYETSPKSLEHVETECSFFPYQTEFQSLAEVFNMSDDRAALKNGTRPWYVGWSNCDSDLNDVGSKLRSQYSRPYFLPRYSSNMATDWIFMGGAGFGSGMHIDAVDRPSWQAQVSGTKTWLLDPSPECWNQCHRLEVTVEKGDIIVVDTNIWYHSTRVNAGNISITIGAEYD